MCFPEGFEDIIYFFQFILLVFQEIKFIWFKVKATPTNLAMETVGVAMEFPVVWAETNGIETSKLSMVSSPILL